MFSIVPALMFFDLDPSSKGVYQIRIMLGIHPSINLRYLPYLRDFGMAGF